MLTSTTNLDLIYGVLAKEVYSQFYPDTPIRDDQWERYHKTFRRMIQARPAEIDLHSLRPATYLVSQANTTSLVDYATILRFVTECLRLRVSDDVRNSRATVSEEAFEGDLTSRTGLLPCYPRNKKFKLGHDPFGEADLSYRLGSVYIPIDVKAYLVTVEFDRGDYKAVRNRLSYVNKWVQQAEDLAASLKTQPKGSNYDLLGDGFTHVLPIVCSPFHEYIGESSDPYWLSETIPRVATPAEIAEFLASNTEDSLKHHHNAVRLINEVN